MPNHNPLRKAQLNSGFQMDLSNFDPSAPSTEFSDILNEYDTDRLMGEYGEYFDEYDPSREAFAQRALALQEGDIGAGFQQQQARFDRESAALDFGQQQQLGEMQRAESSFGLAQQGLDLDEQQALAQQQFQRAQFGRQESALGRQMDAIGMQEQQALQSGRNQLFDIYEQQQEDMGGGFASAGRRDVRAQRALDAQTGAFDTQLRNVRDRTLGLQEGQQELADRRSISESEFGIDTTRRGLQREAMGLDRQAELAGFSARDFQRGQQRGELADQRGFAEGAMQRDLDRAALGFEQDIFGMRQRFADQTRSSLLGLMDSGADIDRFERGYTSGTNEFISNPSISNTSFQNPYMSERFGQTGGGGVGTFDALSTDAQDYMANRQGYGATQAGQQFYNDYSMRGR
tara:strand:- start:1579 stop:2787 length:1209 start_codon:yes stop_codon:yes gene_type:complete